MKTIKDKIGKKVDTSGFEWSEEMMEKVHLKVLLHMAKNLSDYDISFIEKLDEVEGTEEKINAYIKEKGIDLEEVLKKEIEFVKANDK